MSRIYKVTLKVTDSVIRYVRAETATRALKAVTGDLYSTEVVSSDEIFEAVKAGTFEVLDAVKQGGDT